MSTAWKLWRTSPVCVAEVEALVGSFVEAKLGVDAGAQAGGDGSQQYGCNAYSLQAVSQHLPAPRLLLISALQAHVT